MKKGIILLVSLVVALLCYLHLDGATTRATMYLENGILQEQAEEALKQEGDQEAKVTALFFQKNVSADLEADIFEICGEARLLTGSMATLSEEDIAGCLISESLATKLFKSTKVKGNELELEGNAYTIRGVYPAKDKQIIRLNQDEKLLFNQVRIEGKEQEVAATTLQNFAMRHGLKGSILQWVEYIGIVKGLLLLAFATLVMIPWFFVRKMLPRLPWSMVRKPFIQKMILIGYIGVVIILLVRQVHIPIEMIPAKWSDFANWGEWFENVNRNLSNVFTLEKVGYEQSFLPLGLWSMIGSIGVVFMAILIIKDIENYFKSTKDKFMRE